MKGKLSIFIVLVIILSISLIAFGATAIEEIKASLANDMKFRVDGKEWQPKEVDGSPLSPIIFKGRSYVPVRALLEEKEVKVDFDDSTRTILLDFPKWEAPELNSNSPFIIKKSDESNTDKEIIKYELIANKDFNIGEMPLTNEITLALDENVEILIDDKLLNLKELTKKGITYDITSGKAIVEYNTISKSITKVEHWGDPHENLNGKRIRVIITLSGPPWELKIKLTW